MPASRAVISENLLEAVMGLFKKISPQIAALLLIGNRMCCANSGISQTFVLNPGVPVANELKYSNSRYSVVFEDDGSTAYFYAIDYADSIQPIQEAMHIYNVENIHDKDSASTLELRWSRHGAVAGIWINGYPHAIFDFSQKRGYCRTNFPKPGKWMEHDFSWDDRILRIFK